MLKEKNPLLKLKIKKEKIFLFELYKKIIEGIYTLFDLILEKPIENFWFELFNIFFGYFQLIIHSFDRTVSK